MSLVWIEKYTKVSNPIRTFYFTSAIFLVLTKMQGFFDTYLLLKKIEKSRNIG